MKIGLIDVDCHNFPKTKLLLDNHYRLWYNMNSE